MPKCLLLLSGGLDSMLVLRILREQGVEVTPICFKSYFCGCKKAEKVAEELGMKLKIFDFGDIHLETVKNPKFGYGKGMNPCIDCHLLMLKKAREIMEKENFDFIATGEVLGERPFSQNLKALKLIEKEAGLAGLLLRPLSAKLLPETIVERKGLVEREKLFGISGRSRKTQLELVNQFKIKEFATPAGGCILTDSEYSKKLKELLKRYPGADGNDCQLLRMGRVFWENECLLIIGRNQKENEELKKIKKKKDLILEPENFPGPTVLIRSFAGEIEKEIKEKTKALILKYSKKIYEEPRVSEIS